MSFELVKIGESNLKIADGNYSAKYPRSDEFVSSGAPFIRANNFFNKSITDDDIYYISKEKHAELKKGHLKFKDVLITTRGLIGKVALVPERHDDSNINAQIVLLRCNEGWHPEYLLHVLTSDFVTRQLPSLTTGTALKQLPVKNLKKLKIPLPPLSEQKKIAEILDAADSLRQKDQQLVEHYDRLSQSLFLDMFGDPVANSMNWKNCSLAEHGKFKNGLNFKKGELGLKVKYLGVGNFKQHSKIEDIKSLGLIDLNSAPSEDYFLKDEDIVFVRSNGNANLVGRCIVIYPKDIKVTYSGFCIRYRIKNVDLNATYLAHLFREKSFRRLLLQSGQGANIQNINQKLLSELKIPLPPIDLQHEFSNRLKSIEKQKELAQQSLKKSDDLFNSLLQRAFKGEL